jgi:Uma2 family endonuclease
MRHNHSSQRRVQPSFDELLSSVRDLPKGYEGHILEGTMYVTDPPSVARAHTLAEIAAMVVAGSSLGDPGPDAWAFLSDVEIAVGAEGIVTADVAGFRLGASELAAATSPVRFVPAWVCEVLGGGSRAFTLTAKRRAYAELGVGHLWIADPEAQVLEIFENHRGKWLLSAALSEEARVSVQPFEDLHFDASELWIPTPSRRIGPASGALKGH